MKLTNEAKMAIILKADDWREAGDRLAKKPTGIDKDMWTHEAFADWRALRTLCELFNVDEGLVAEMVRMKGLEGLDAMNAMSVAVFMDMFGKKGE